MVLQVNSENFSDGVVVEADLRIPSKSTFSTTCVSNVSGPLGSASPFSV